MAEWLRRGLQNLVHRFNSGRRLHKSPNGGIGIRVRLKIEWRNPYGFKSHFGHHKKMTYNFKSYFLCLIYQNTHVFNLKHRSNIYKAGFCLKFCKTVLIFRLVIISCLMKKHIQIHQNHSSVQSNHFYFLFYRQ